MEQVQRVSIGDSSVIRTDPFHGWFVRSRVKPSAEIGQMSIYTLAHPLRDGKFVWPKGCRFTYKSPALARGPLFKIFIPPPTLADVANETDVPNGTKLQLLTTTQSTTGNVRLPSDVLTPRFLNSQSSSSPSASPTSNDSKIFERLKDDTCLNKWRSRERHPAMISGPQQKRRRLEGPEGLTWGLTAVSAPHVLQFRFSGMATCNQHAPERSPQKIDTTPNLGNSCIHIENQLRGEFTITAGMPPALAKAWGASEYYSFIEGWCCLAEVANQQSHPKTYPCTNNLSRAEAESKCQPGTSVGDPGSSVPIRGHCTAAGAICLTINPAEISSSGRAIPPVAAGGAISLRSDPGALAALLKLHSKELQFKGTDAALRVHIWKLKVTFDKLSVQPVTDMDTLTRPLTPQVGASQTVDRQDRTEMIHIIIRTLRVRRPDAPPHVLQRLPQWARALESWLYSSAANKSDYSDKRTIGTRLCQASQAIIKMARTSEARGSMSVSKLESEYEPQRTATTKDEAYRTSSADETRPSHAESTQAKFNLKAKDYSPQRTAVKEEEGGEWDRKGWPPLAEVARAPSADEAICASLPRATDSEVQVPLTSRSSPDLRMALRPTCVACGETALARQQPRSQPPPTVAYARSLFGPRGQVASCDQLNLRSIDDTHQG